MSKITPGTKKRRVVYMTDAEWEALSLLASKTGRSRSQILAGLLLAYLAPALKQEAPR